MSLDYSQHYVAIRDHLIDCARLDPAHAIAAAREHEREACGALDGLAAEVQGAIPGTTSACARQPMETT